MFNLNGVKCKRVSVNELHPYIAKAKHCVILSFAETKVWNFSLRPEVQSET